MVVQVAAATDKTLLAGGLQDGRVWVIDLAGGSQRFAKAEKGEPITALALSPDGQRLAWGDEAGEAGLVELASLG
jgi:hypothetical protein